MVTLLEDTGVRGSFYIVHRLQGDLSEVVGIVLQLAEAFNMPTSLVCAASCMCVMHACSRVHACVRVCGDKDNDIEILFV